MSDKYVVEIASPEGFIGPPDQLRSLQVNNIYHMVNGDEGPYLWKIGGYYIWWDGSTWFRDGSVRVDETFVRQALWNAGGKFEWMD